MAQTIKIRRTNTPGKKPIFNTDIVTGEFGFNTADGLLFIGDSSQTRTVITADNWVTGSLSLKDQINNRIHALDNGRLVLGTPTDETPAIGYVNSPSRRIIISDDFTPTYVVGSMTASKGAYITGSDLVLYDADLVATKNDAYAVNFYGTASYVHTSSRLQVDGDSEYHLGTDKLLRLVSGDNVTLGYAQNAGPGVTVTINASGGDLTDLNNFTGSINDATSSFLLNTTDTFTGTLTVNGTMDVNTGYYESNGSPIMYFDTSGTGVANIGVTARTFKAVGNKVVMDQPITASGISEFNAAEVGLGMGIVIKRDDNGALHTAPVATPTNIFYAADETGAPTGSDRFILREDQQLAQFGKATPIGVATTTFGNNLNTNPSRISSGSHIMQDGQPLVTNAIYRFGRFHLVGIGRAGAGGLGAGGLVPPVLEEIPGYGPTGWYQQILPNPSNITGYSTIANGGLGFGNAYIDVTPNNISDYGIPQGSTIMVTQYGLTLPGSPAILTGGGSIRFFASESYATNESGSFASPFSSASIEFAMAPDSSSLLIRTGKGASVVDALYISQSGRRPLIGIGTQDPKSALDIRDVKDDGTGTEFVLKTTRSGAGASIGDKAGTLNFTVESGSFNDYKTSGSVAVIDAEVTGVSELGVQGDLVLKTASTTKSAPKEVLRINSFNSYFSSSLKVLQNLTIGQNTVLMTNIEVTVSGDSEQNLTTFASNNNDGAIYDYVLVDSSNGYARTGQFMVCHNGTTVSYTDTSTRPVGGDTSDPVLTALDPALGIVAVRITNGDGYTFKSLRKLI